MVVAFEGIPGKLYVNTLLGQGADSATSIAPGAAGFNLLTTSVRAALAPQSFDAVTDTVPPVNPEL